MNYLELVEESKKSGTWTEKAMWESVESMSDMLCEVKASHPQKYWDFMREQHGIMFSKHYHKDFAEYDVSQMHYTDKEGKKHMGAYWTVEQIEEATNGMTFPSGVTKWDKFVAFNGFHADMCKIYTDEQIIKGAYEFFFMDEDWNKEKSGSSPCKVWEYFSCKYKD